MRPILYLVVVFVCAALPAAAVPVKITDYQVIPLQEGVNEIPHLVPDGRNGKIIKTWRNNGNAYGYDLFLVTLEDKVVGVDTDNGFKDVIRDEPHTRQDAIKSVRFAWGKLGDEKLMLLITATRKIEPGYGLSDPGTVVFDVYRLVSNGPLGTTGDYFMRINEFSSEQKYCNSDMALNQNLGLPLPEPYEGRGQPDGCS